VFGSGDGGIEFSFRGAGGGKRLGFTFVGDGTAGKKESESSRRTAFSKVVGMSGINKTSNGHAGFEGRENGQGSGLGRVGQQGESRQEDPDRGWGGESGCPISGCSEGIRPPF